MFTFCVSRRMLSLKEESMREKKSIIFVICEVLEVAEGCYESCGLLDVIGRAVYIFCKCVSRRMISLKEESIRERVSIIFVLHEISL